MKTIYIFQIIFFICLSLAIGCRPTSESGSALKEADRLAGIPALLDRHANLRQGKEWDQVQNQYVQLREKVTNHKNPEEPRLLLAQLFINEARITGEHGYYYPAALNLLNATLEKAAADKDLTFRLLYTKAGILMSLHQFEAGHQVAIKALELNPYNSGIYGVLVDANVELGNYEKAVEMADKMVGIRPDLRSYARVSYLREIHGDWQGAIEAMQMAVKAGFPGYEQTAWTRLTLGNLYSAYGDKEQAAKQYEIALANRPDYPFALAALARLEMEKKNYDKAELLLEKAVEIIPEFSFYQELAEIYRLTGRTQAFEDTCRELLAMLREDEASGHRMDLEKAVVFSHLLEDQELALEAAWKTYEERPANIEVNRVLADIYIRAGKPEKAKEYLKAAESTHSRNPALLELKDALALN